MFDEFQLAAIVNQGTEVQLKQIPMHQKLQDALAASWFEQYEAFLADKEEIDFNPGYQPEEHQRLRLLDYRLPKWLAGENSKSVPNLEVITNHDAFLDATRAIVAFVRFGQGEEVILFQNFNRSHVIRPGRFLFLQNKTFETTKGPALTLDSKLSAVYEPTGSKLLFHNFRMVNIFLPLADFYEEASEQQIREVLSHNLLAPEDANSLATGASQWFRKRFAMLRASGVLDSYSAEQIQASSNGYDVAIKLSNGKIVFPAEKAAAKKLLQFLNEELFRGAITETLYETNSKREAE